ncbi:MAG: methionine synthase [Thermomicrobiales bacterium]
MSSSPAIHSLVRPHALSGIPLGSPAASAKPDLYLEAVRSRTVVYDGSMGATILNMQLTAEDYGGKEGFNDYLATVRPEIIEQIHASFLEVGCDVLETDTFGSSWIKAEEYGLGDQTYNLNYNAAALARRVADQYSTAKKPRFVAGSIGPTGLLPASEDPMLGNHRFTEVRDLFTEQIKGLVDGGSDVLIIETVQDILELKAAIHAAQLVFREKGRRLPIQASVTLDTSGRMLLGTDIAAALNILEHQPVDIIGLNCSTGPDYMREPARYLGEYSTRPVSIIPNAGIPINVNGLAVFPMEPEPMARGLREMVEDFGVNIVGGCCGTTPDHLLATIREVETKPVVARPIKPLPQVASMIKAVDLQQDPAPTIIGERVNTLGSRKVKRLVLADDLDGVLEVATSQMEEGAHTLDVCVALTELTNEKDVMRRLVKKLALTVDGPLVIDSTEADVVQDALEQYPGRAIINSINMENGRKRIEDILPLAQAHGSALVALTIDEDGMAKTRERKLEVAQKIHDIVTGEYGLAPEDLIFDALTFPLTTGDPELVNSAIETIEGIRMIEEAMPGVMSVLGVSNVSFGINPAARKVVNAVFLYHAIKAGLDLAIIHPSHVVPFAEIPQEERDLAEDLVLNRRPDALQRIIEFYEGKTEDSSSAIDPMAGMNVRERLHFRIVFRKKDGIEADIDEAVAENGDAVEILNNVLLPAMKEVGDKFGAGELILPFVLQSAEAMKKAVSQLENYLEKVEGSTKGHVVLATVYGDVHDIGKNLVNTILSNNGYTVHDLGKQVPISTIIDKAVEVKADAIGLSALLVSTSKQMPLCVKELHHQGLSFPVMIGGAAINRPYAHRSLFVEEDTPYPAGVFYAKDAFEGLALMDKIVNIDERKRLIEENLAAALNTLGKPSRESFSVPAKSADTTRSNTSLVTPPTPPFWGVREMTDFTLDDVWPHLDLQTLFRLHWGGKGLKGEAWEAMQRDEFLPRLHQLEEDAKATGWLNPRVRYGYFPANAQGNDLIIFDPEDHDKELLRFDFPRQPARERLCLADYFQPVESGIKDVVVFQIVTMGKEATQRTEETQARGDYSESFYSHGLSVSSAEALAEMVHQRVRAALGIGEEGGKRYSWGYPSIPDLAQHELVDRLLDFSSVGIELTEGFQFSPEQTTAAIVVHHPEAKYYGLARSGGGESGISSTGEIREAAAANVA